jgi:hypothetical protein
MDEVKIGQRNSKGDYKRMRRAFKLAQMILGELRLMGYTEADDDGAPLEVKADMKLEEIAEMVEDAVEEALMEMSLIMPDDDLGEDAEAYQMIMEDYGKGYNGEDGDDEYLKVHVYADYAVACIGGGMDWKIPYRIEGGRVILGEPRTWQRVEKVWAPVESMEVKLLDDGTIVAQAIRFGTADDPDISAQRDYFTKNTQFWLEQWNARPMLYDHAMDEGTADAPIVGTWLKAWADDTGIWLQGQLDRAHKYADAIKELARRGVLKISTDSAPHLVRRKAGPNGTNEVVRWPILAASLTPRPAEPRLPPVALKSDIVATTDDAGTAGGDRRDGAKAAADERISRLADEIAQLMETR